MSNKKPFEYIEDKIKLAAENSLPAFDEKAWQRMETLLNKEEKKRRPFFWMWIALPLLMAGGWGAYEFSRPSPLPKERSAAASTTGKTAIPETKEKPASVTSSENNVGIVDESQKIKTGKLSAGIDINKVPSKSREVAFSDVPSRHKKSAANKQTEIKSAVLDDGIVKPVSTTEKINIKKNTNSDNNIQDVPRANNTLANPPAVDSKTGDSKTVKQPIANADDKKVDDKINADAEKIEKPANKKAALKSKAGNSNGFYLLATAGPDAGSTKLFSYSNSSVTPKYGIGAGYQFNKKWSVQTGFYATNKKYVAGPGDYHPEKGSYWDLVDIKKVRAECLVYEIPLTVRYNFAQTGSVTYYGAVSGSSYIMVKEDYNYFYVRDNMPYEKYWQYRGHKHLFSTLTFSAGIEKKLSDKFSILAEPSFSIPMSGVGDGKVRLFSSSLQVGMKYLPFKKSH